MREEAPLSPRRILVVANPISGRGRGQRAGTELAAALARHGVEVELLMTDARGHAPRLLAEARAADLVVAVGGDGTLSEVLQGLPSAATPVGLLPCGTANVLAHALRLPCDPEGAARAFVRARVRPLDVARVGGRYAHLVVGVGLDGCAVREVEARRRGPIRKSAYIGATLRALRRYRPVPLAVTLDGRRLERPYGLVWVANTPRYADLLRIARDARLDDGLWEVYLFPSGSVPEIARACVRGFVAHLPGGAVTMQRARSVRIEAPEPVPYQVDGDLGGETPVELELLAERFRIVVP
jgi:YegS/Rv2252/BmrU family lipid kinase